MTDFSNPLWTRVAHGEALSKYEFLAETQEDALGKCLIAAKRGRGSEPAIVVVHALGKTLRGGVAGDDAFLERVALATRLRSAALLRSYELGTSPENTYVVTEYFESVGFDTLMQLPSGSFAQGLAVLLALLSGLHAAHQEVVLTCGTQQPFTHRWVSPESVRIGFSGTVKLANAGFSECFRSVAFAQRRLTQMEFLAPELVRGEAAAASADVYAVGVMLGDLLARWYARNPVAEVRARPTASDAFFALESERNSLANALSEVSQRARSHDPGVRFANASDMHSAILKCMPDLEQVPILRALGATLATHFAEERRFRAQILDERLRVIHLRDSLETDAIDDSQTGAAVQPVPTFELFESRERTAKQIPAVAAQASEQSLSTRSNASRPSQRVQALTVTSSRPASLGSFGDEWDAPLLAPASPAVPAFAHRDSPANGATLTALDLDSLFPAGAARSYEPVIVGDLADEDLRDDRRLAAAAAVVFPSSRPPPDLAVEAAGWEIRMRRRRRHAMVVVVVSSLSGGVLGALYKLLL